MVGPIIDRLVLLLPPLGFKPDVFSAVAIDVADLAKAKKAEELELAKVLEADATEGVSLLFPGLTVTMAKAGSGARKGYKAAFHIRAGAGEKGDPTLTLQVGPTGSKALGYSCRADWNPARFTQSENARIFEGLFQCASAQNVAAPMLLPQIRVTRVDAAFDLPEQGFSTFAFAHRKKQVIQGEGRRLAGLTGIRFGAEGDSHVVVYDRLKLPHNPSPALRIEFRIMPKGGDQPLLALPHLVSPLDDLLVMDTAALPLTKAHRRHLATAVNVAGLREALGDLSLDDSPIAADLLLGSTPPWWAPGDLWGGWPASAHALLAVAACGLPLPPVLAGSVV
ncbi:hypothetical protein AAFN86_16005 [Roseomonas sp. CAU 1739]|uniref:hypothetical protein n=1 Tax=Roseomonas sp. CAU 1739 TaxID=3140364 RepID=UPI00325BE475